ncbi:hypothetical protein LCGC14_2651510 [marine sediment metagenome]|uniref:Uncharacterized protein n=1 Tax=marine sediment metagenome TaxID=412755 RepID=A0A0F9CLP3_9ZZZZ
MTTCTEAQAVPFVPEPGAVERTRRALAEFAAAVRADKVRPLTEEEWQAKRREGWNVIFD